MDWIEAQPRQPAKPLARSEDRTARYLPDHVRRTLLLAAAEDLFLTHGFVATTMSDIARAAGMSKKTIYQVFTSKTALFEALLRDRLGAEIAPPDVSALTPDAALTALLTAFAGQILTPGQIALCRLILASSGKLPEIGAVFRTHCARREEPLRAWLAAAIARGTLRIADLDEAHGTLLALAIGPMHWQMLAEIGAPPSASRIAGRIQSAVGIFLREYAAQSASVIA